MKVLIFVFWILVCFISERTLAGTHPYFSFGYGRGGDTLTDATGGQNYITQAGSGLYMVGGIILPVSPTTPHRFEAQLGIGYMFQEDARDGAENRTNWSRVPLEAIYYYNNTRDDFRLGWGATYQIEGKLTAYGYNSPAQTSVENAVGYVLAAEKSWDASPEDANYFSVGIKYVNINYRLNRFNKVVDGNTYYFTFSALSF